MNISAAGQKRVCASCQARFFDLNRDPIVCPTWRAEFFVPPPPPPRPVRGPRKFTPYAPVGSDASGDEAEAEETKAGEADAAGEVLMLDEDDESDAVHFEGAESGAPEKRERDT